MNEQVLLIEDDASMQEVVALGLERHGYSVVAENDGKRGLKRFLKAEEAGDRFHLVLLDLMLPSMSGSTRWTRWPARWVRLT
ncbi:MAG: response regulator [Actinomycetota bacterium]